MLKLMTVIFMLFVICNCYENTDVVMQESRAKKKKSPIRLIAIILLFVLSKVAVLKVASFFMFMAVFQKIFSAAGLFLSYFMKNRGIAPPVSVEPQQMVPQPMYGLPQDYNTVGYSYGPPEHESIRPDSSLPSIAEIGHNFNSWLTKQK